MSFLLYDDFDGAPHPALLRSTRVYLRRASFDIRDYSASQNPPILHWKDSFVDATYPHYDRFRELTVSEEEARLLSHADIGTRDGWQRLLAERGFAVAGHRLVRSAEITIT